MLNNDILLDTYTSIQDTFDSGDFHFPLEFIRSNNYYDVWSCNDWYYISNRKIIELIKGLGFYDEFNPSHTALVHILLCKDIVIQTTKDYSRSYITPMRAIRVLKYILKYFYSVLRRNERFILYNLYRNLCLYSPESILQE